MGETAIRISMASGSVRASVEELRALSVRAFDREPEIQALMPLAGPNDMIQFLLDWELWEPLVLGGAALYGGAIVTAAGTDTWAGMKSVITRALKKKTKPVQATIVEQIAKIAVEAMSNGNIVVLGLPIDEKFQRRNLGVELVRGTPEEVYRAAVVLANIGPDVVAEINAELATGPLYASVENSDASCKVEVRPDGSVVVALQRGYESPDQRFTIEFDPQGERKNDPE